MKTDLRALADDAAESDLRRLERVVPEIVRRVLEAGYLKLSESPESVRRAVGELKLPKEVLLAALAHLDETRTGLAREVREFLERTSVADELTRALTSMSLEIRTSVRFVPNGAGEPAPDVSSRVSVRRTRASTPPATSVAAPPPPASPLAEPEEDRRGQNE